MKKYLMTGIAALAMCAGFTGCSSHDMEEATPENLAKLEEMKVQQKYEQAFIKAFGQPSANQTWGFGSTFARTRATDPDANMWGGNGVDGSRYPDFVVPDPLTDDQKRVVRRWFQRNQNPDNHAVTYTNFFVQQVYKGGTKTDDGSLTTETYLAGNGDIITSGQKMNYLMAGQVGTDTDWQGNTVAVYDHMYNFNGADYSGGAKNVDVWDGKLDPDATKDFNDRKKYHGDQIQLMVNSSTSSFGYHTSQSNQEFHNKYVVIPGDLIDPIVAGMYFVGFDYEATGNNSNEYLITEDTNGDITYNGKQYHKGGADGYYSDWIVRITKAEGIPAETYTGRIMAEDLSADDHSDFDFNDVVFDWKKVDGGMKIQLRAAGGTLPLNIGGTPSDDKKTISGGYEVHAQFGVTSTGTMINTGVGANGITRTAAPFTLPGINSEEDIHVYVQKGGLWMEINAPKGKATAKLNVPCTTKWVDEFVDIENAYPYFNGYVSGARGDFWADPNETFLDLNLSNNQ